MAAWKLFLQKLEVLNKVDLSQYHKETVVALLRFLYINDTSPSKIVAPELEQLATRSVCEPPF